MMPALRVLKLILCMFGLYYGSVGCVAFRGHELSDELTSKYPTISNKVSINFSNESVLREEGGRLSPYDEVQPMVEGYMLSSSGFFLTTQSIAGDEDLHLKFQTITREKNMSWLRRLPWGLYCGLSWITLGVIPYIQPSDRELEVEVMQASKSIKKYHYTDHVWYVSSLFVLPWWRYGSSYETWSGASEVTGELDHNLVKHFLLDFHRDFMPKPQTPKAPKAHS